jgi:hypothetical protein
VTSSSDYILQKKQRHFSVSVKVMLTIELAVRQNALELLQLALDLADYALHVRIYLVQVVCVRKQAPSSLF